MLIGTKIRKHILDGKIQNWFYVSISELDFEESGSAMKLEGKDVTRIKVSLDIILVLS